MPHRQVPVSEQLSACRAPHIAQLAPVAPHEAGANSVQVVPTQHPVRQDVWSQTHPPLTHRWPEMHAAVPPQRHSPTLEQRSAFAVSHATQAIPAGAHEPNVREVQAAPEQQPLGHESASHSQLPATQLWPSAQAGTHPLAPPVPPPDPPPPPPAPPSTVLHSARQNPSQHSGFPDRQSPASVHEVSPRVEGSEQLHPAAKTTPSANASRKNPRIVTP